ncbi:unnamed protein product [Gadus morhua 'NCC']
MLPNPALKTDTGGTVGIADGPPLQEPGPLRSIIPPASLFSMSELFYMLARPAISFIIAGVQWGVAWNGVTPARGMDSSSHSSQGSVPRYTHPTLDKSLLPRYHEAADWPVSRCPSEPPGVEEHQCTANTPDQCLHHRMMR